MWLCACAQCEHNCNVAVRILCTDKYIVLYTYTSYIHKTINSFVWSHFHFSAGKRIVFLLVLFIFNSVMINKWNVHSTPTSSTNRMKKVYETLSSALFVILWVVNVWKEKFSNVFDFNSISMKFYDYGFYDSMLWIQAAFSADAYSCASVMVFVCRNERMCVCKSVSIFGNTLKSQDATSVYRSVQYDHHRLQF